MPGVLGKVGLGAPIPTAFRTCLGKRGDMDGHTLKHWLLLGALGIAFLSGCGHLRDRRRLAVYECLGPKSDAPREAFFTPPEPPPVRTVAPEKARLGFSDDERVEGTTADPGVSLRARLGFSEEERTETPVDNPRRLPPYLPPIPPGESQHAIPQVEAGRAGKSDVSLPTSWLWYFGARVAETPATANR